MKAALFLLTLLASNALLAAPSLVDVSRLQYGKQWPFTREEVTLQCRPGPSLFVINPSTLARYPLNDLAREQVKAGKIQAISLDAILLDDPEKPGTKMSLQPIQQRALALCEH